MPTPLHPWRDTLLELGVMGLVPPPAPEPAPEAPRPRPAPTRTTPPLPPRPVHPAAVLPEPDRSDPVAFPPPEALAAAKSLEALGACVQGCLACPLGAGRIRFVFGEGAPHADLMFIGEGPGRDEDLQGRPFVGRAGELLDKMIAAIGLQRSQVYITNIVKCRPPDNRTPTPQESQTCLRYLKRQIELVRPKVIVTLGATPLRELAGVSTGITRTRGQWKQIALLGGIPLMPTFHPAYVLRQYTQDVRRAVWEDLRQAKGWLDEHPG